MKNISNDLKLHKSRLPGVVRQVDNLKEPCDSAVSLLKGEFKILRQNIKHFNDDIESAKTSILLNKQSINTIHNRLLLSEQNIASVKLYLLRNVRGIMSSVPYLCQLLHDHDIDICVITEHWLTIQNIHFVDSFDLQYSCYAKCDSDLVNLVNIRSCRGKGGVAIMLKKNLAFCIKAGVFCPCDTIKLTATSCYFSLCRRVEKVCVDRQLLRYS